MASPKGHPPYNKNGEGGAPKRFTTEFIENEAVAFEKWLEDPKHLWFKDFARERGYLSEQLALFAKENKRFAVAYKKAQDWQQSLLVRGGLVKKFNYNMCALLLSNLYNMNAKTEQTISGDAANPFTLVINDIKGQSKELVDE